MVETYFVIILAMMSHIADVRGSSDFYICGISVRRPNVDSSISHFVGVDFDHDLR